MIPVLVIYLVLGHHSRSMKQKERARTGAWMQHCNTDLERHIDQPNCSSRDNVPPIVMFIHSSIHPVLLTAAFASSKINHNEVRVTR